MAVLRFTNGFDKMSDAKFAETVSYIAGEVGKHREVFEKPDPSVERIVEMVTAFRTLVQKAATGNYADIALKNQYRETLLNEVYNLGYYILYVAKGNRVKAELSGMKLAKPPAPAPPIEKPENIMVVNTNQTGVMEISVNAVKGARAYVHQYTTDPTLKEDSWISVNSTSRKCRLEGMPPGTVFYFRVAAIGTRDQVMYSDVVSRMAV